MADNLYVHFPFCRRKCSYCALYSRTDVSSSERAAYVRRLVEELGARCPTPCAKLRTVYFGGGSPALCDLTPLASILRPHCGEETEFTVELHPLDVTEAKLAELKSLGVNRISMGVQSLDDATLADMGRGYTVDEAERAFALVRRHFDNAGIDLIVGYPGDEVEDKVERKGGGGDGRSARRGTWNLDRLAGWGLKHCSVYSLQNERGLKNVPDDNVVLDRLRQIAKFLESIGLERYEISNYAVSGYECRHNFAVWRGEDYVGLGEGACGRIGLKRTIGRKTGIEESDVTPEFDLKERAFFRLRTREGLDAAVLQSLPSFPSMLGALDRNVVAGLLKRDGLVYRLTERGTEVCDSILADLV